MDKKFFSKIKYELILFLVLCIQFVIRIPTPEHLNTLGNCRATLYTLTYHVALEQRMLIGTIITFFCSKITLKIVYNLTLIVSIITIVFIAKYLARVIKTADESSRNTVFVLITLFMVVSTNYTSFFNPYNYAVFDLYLFLLTMVMICIVRIKYVRFLIPVLCLVCVAIHEVYVTTYMVIIGCVLLYELVKNKFSFRSILLTATSYFSIIGSFVFLQFFTKPLNYSSSSQLIKALAPTTDINMNKSVFDFGYFYNNSLKENFDLLFNTHVEAAFLTFFLITPIYALFVYIWKSMMFFSETRLQKFVYFVFAISPIMILPSFFIAIDYDRWFAAINITQFIMIFYLYIVKDKRMHLTIEKLQTFYQKHTWVFVALILYFSALTFLKINTTGFIGDYLKEHFVWR